MYVGPVWHTYKRVLHTKRSWHTYKPLLAGTSGSFGTHTCSVRKQLLHRHPELKYVQPALPLSVEKFPQEVHIIGGERVRRVDPREEVPTKRRERAALNHAPVRRVAAVRPEALLDAVIRGHLRKAHVVKPERGVAGRLQVIKGRSWPARLRLADAVEPVCDAAEEVERLAPPRRHRGAQQGVLRAALRCCLFCLCLRLAVRTAHGGPRCASALPEDTSWCSPAPHRRATPRGHTDLHSGEADNSFVRCAAHWASEASPRFCFAHPHQRACLTSGEAPRDLGCGSDAAATTAGRAGASPRCWGVPCACGKPEDTVAKLVALSSSCGPHSL